jgi:hypothetical protein
MQLIIHDISGVGFTAVFSWLAIISCKGRNLLNDDDHDDDDDDDDDDNSNERMNDIPKADEVVRFG